MSASACPRIAHRLISRRFPDSLRGCEFFDMPFRQGVQHRADKLLEEAKLTRLTFHGWRQPGRGCWLLDAYQSALRAESDRVLSRICVPCHQLLAL